LQFTFYSLNSDIGGDTWQSSFFPVLLQKALGVNYSEIFFLKEMTFIILAFLIDRGFPYVNAMHTFFLTWYELEQLALLLLWL